VIGADRVVGDGSPAPAMSRMPLGTWLGRPCPAGDVVVVDIDGDAVAAGVDTVAAVELTVESITSTETGAADRIKPHRVSPHGGGRDWFMSSTVTVSIRPPDSPYTMPETQSAPAGSELTSSPSTFRSRMVTPAAPTPETLMMPAIFIPLKNAKACVPVCRST